MKKAAAHPTHDTDDPLAPALLAGSFALQFLDTTWRVATPVLLFVGIGIYADLHLHTKPWLTLLGIVVGFAGAALLIKQQIAAVNAREENKK